MDIIWLCTLGFGGLYGLYGRFGGRVSSDDSRGVFGVVDGVVGVGRKCGTVTVGAGGLFLYRKGSVMRKIFRCLLFFLVCFGTWLASSWLTEGVSRFCRVPRVSGCQLVSSCG